MNDQKGEKLELLSQRKGSFLPQPELPLSKRLGAKVRQTLGFMAQRARLCSTQTCCVPVLMPRLPGQMRGSRCQRPFLRRAIVAQALKQTGSDFAHERVCIPKFPKGLQALVAAGVAAFASALVAASPAGATLGPAEVLQLQDTVNEVWGKLLSLEVNWQPRTCRERIFSLSALSTSHSLKREGRAAEVQSDELLRFWWSGAPHDLVYPLICWAARS